ncbi:MAG: serine/threonine-protein kinase [Pseudomonadota bacterium]
MTDDENKPTDLAQQIADQESPDWDSLPDDQPNVDALKILHSISSELRRSETLEPEKPKLFQWRHLEVREEIGSGAFGRVYRAWDAVLNREVALKLAKEREDFRVDPKMIIAEARSMARARHPNILAIHGADTEEQQVGIWTDLLTGRTLDEYLEESGSLSVAEVLRLATPLADALTLIHRRAMVHGDVKPSNIMIQADGTPILMDFGAAREQGRGYSSALGSPRFMAPEQFHGAMPGPASDLFAFGVVLARCLSGAYPWPAESLEELEAAYDAETPPDLSGAPRRFRRLLSELLARTPEARPSAEQLSIRLEHLRTAPQRRLRRAAVAGVIGAMGLGLVTSVIALRSERAGRVEVQAIRDVTVGAIQAADPNIASGPTAVKLIFEKLDEFSEPSLTPFPDALAEIRLLAADGQMRFGETEAALALFQKTLGDLDPDDKRHIRRRAIAWAGIADIYADTGELDKAEHAVRKTLEISEKRFDQHAEGQKLVARNKLIGLLNLQGRAVEQRDEQLKLLADREALYGVDAVETAVDHHNLATAYRSLGEFEQALASEQRTLEILNTHEFGRSLRAVFVHHALASIHIDLAQLDDAQQMINAAEEIGEASLPPDHSMVSELRVQQARLWRKQGELDRAESALLALLELKAVNLKSAQKDARRNLAYIYLTREQWSQAQSLFAELRSAVNDPENWRMSYLSAAEAYAGARIDLTGVPEALEKTQRAQAELTAKNLTRLEAFENLSAWSLALENPSPGGSSAP